MTSLKTSVIALSLLALAACGGAKKQDKATGTGYQGDPLFTVSGQMALTSGGQPSNPIRLAVAWYPDQTQASAPQAIITQDVQYQGTFPLNYTFSFFSTPPATALNDYKEAGQTYKVAWGILMAYEDLNGNGQLDTIPAGGSPIDHILGTSIGDYYNGNIATTDNTYVAYVDGSAPPSWSGFTPGFNLWKNQQVVPSTTQVPLQLDNTNELDFLVCEELISGANRSFDLPCNIAPTGGVRIAGNVYLSDGVPAVSVRVTDGTNPITNAVVELNGQTVGFDATNGLYYGQGGSLVVNAPGDNVLKVTPPGGTVREFHTKATGDFSLSAPVTYARVKGGTPVQLQWSAAPGTWFYDVRAYRSEAPYTLDHEAIQYATGLGTETASVTMPSVDSWEQTEVVAFDKDYLQRGLGGSSVNAAVLRSATLDVIPATQQLAASGTITSYKYQGTVTDTAYLSAFDGISEIVQNAVVSVNTTVAPWNSQYHEFALESPGVLTLGAANTVKVQQSGKPDFTATVQLPGDFDVINAPTTVAKGGSIALSWNASAGAAGYTVWVSDGVGGQSFYATTTSTSLTVEGFNQEGTVYLSVYAYGPTSGDRHLQGGVQNTMDITVTP